MRGPACRAMARFGTVTFTRSSFPMIIRATIRMDLARADYFCQAKAANRRIFPVVVERALHDYSTGIPVFDAPGGLVCSTTSTRRPGSPRSTNAVPTT